MKASAAAPQVSREPLYTLDGEEIFLRANVEFPAEYAGVAASGARGIGLYRSEFLWTQHNRMPTEEEQFTAYMEVARNAGEDGATIRLFDFGGDKFALDGVEPERNPALGLRAIRLGLRFEDILRTQARALLRVAHHQRIGIVLPMIADVGDVRRARQIIEEERAKLADRNTPSGDVRLGAMIEVPSAVLTVEQIAAEVEFLSLGTNDLVQYLLATDRGNDAVADWFRTLHPAVLLSVRRTLTAAHAANIPVIICGEMAASPLYAFILIGLGARDLSMSAAAIPRVRRVISETSAEKARVLADDCLRYATADDVEELVRQRLGSELPQIFTPEMLPTLKIV
jgi:phosphotransferase system enzyme I (PtsI)